MMTAMTAAFPEGGLVYLNRTLLHYLVYLYLTRHDDVVVFPWDPAKKTRFSSPLYLHSKYKQIFAHTNKWLVKHHNLSTHPPSGMKNFKIKIICLLEG
jgi:hypothetical protein